MKKPFEVGERVAAYGAWFGGSVLLHGDHGTIESIVGTSHLVKLDRYQSHVFHPKQLRRLTKIEPMRIWVTFNKEKTCWIEWSSSKSVAPPDAIEFREVVRKK